MGCATCDTYGWLKLYNPDTLKEVEEYLGSSSYQNLGGFVFTMTNTGDTDQILYSTSRGDFLHLNSLLAFELEGESRFYDKK